MSEHPILFSAEMVRAILDGHKTQTRRVIKPQPSSGIRNSVFVKSGLEDGHGRELVCPYGKPGDLLWVRETWIPKYYIDGKPAYAADLLYTYRDMTEGIKLSPSIFMPRWASRLILTITDVKVERLQAISEEDAIVEGIQSPRMGPSSWGEPSPAIYDFRALWDSINAKRGYSWESNPWVWVITFEKLEAQDE